LLYVYELTYFVVPPVASPIKKIAEPPAPPIPPSQKSPVARIGVIVESVKSV
jgi:hypothetical protein